MLITIHFSEQLFISPSVNRLVNCLIMSALSKALHSVLWKPPFAGVFDFCHLNIVSMPTADIKQALRCTDLADDALQNLVQWSLVWGYLEKPQVWHQINCSRTALWDFRLPLRADLEHRCLTLKLLSKKAHHRTIFFTMWPSYDDDRYIYFVT